MTKTQDTERQASIEHVRELLQDIPVAMLTTISPAGTLRARPMVNVNESFNGELFFFTHDDAAKAEDITANSQVNVSFAVPEKQRYVSVSGRAELLRDTKRSELLWTDECDRWFPEGPQGSHVYLLRVEVECAEYWEEQRGAMVALAGFVQRMLKGDKSKKVNRDHVHWESEGQPSTPK